MAFEDYIEWLKEYLFFPRSSKVSRDARRLNRYNAGCAPGLWETDSSNLRRVITTNIFGKTAGTWMGPKLAHHLEELAFSFPLITRCGVGGERVWDESRLRRVLKSKSYRVVC
jgi:hypothetical protein